MFDGSVDITLDDVDDFVSRLLRDDLQQQQQQEQQQQQHTRRAHVHRVKDVGSGGEDNADDSDSSDTQLLDRLARTVTAAPPTAPTAATIANALRHDDDNDSDDDSADDDDEGAGSVHSSGSNSRDVLHVDDEAQLQTAGDEDDADELDALLARLLRERHVRRQEQRYVEQHDDGGYAAADAANTSSRALYDSDDSDVYDDHLVADDTDDVEDGGGSEDVLPVSTQAEQPYAAPVVQQTPLTRRGVRGADVNKTRLRVVRTSSSPPSSSSSSLLLRRFALWQERKEAKRVQAVYEALMKEQAECTFCPQLAQRGVYADAAADVVRGGCNSSRSSRFASGWQASSSLSPQRRRLPACEQQAMQLRDVFASATASSHDDGRHHRPDDDDDDTEADVDDAEGEDTDGDEDKLHTTAASCVCACDTANSVHGAASFLRRMAAVRAARAHAQRVAAAATARLTDARYIRRGATVPQPFMLHTSRTSRRRRCAASHHRDEARRTTSKSDHDEGGRDDDGDDDDNKAAHVCPPHHMTTASTPYTTLAPRVREQLLFSAEMTAQLRAATACAHDTPSLSLFSLPLSSSTAAAAPPPRRPLRLPL